MVRCAKCKTRIVTHLWIHNGLIYCGVSCQRGAKSQFEKIYRALENMKVDS